MPLNNYQERIDQILKNALPKHHPLFGDLSSAMYYGVYNGGKRLRPSLVYMTATLLGTPLHIVDMPAAAVELVHCFSLIHDDLPAMDNSDFRRGKPSCHKVFGEDIAILAGDALLTLAFDILSNDDLNPLSHSKRLKMLHLLCQASGSHGMVAGQVMDVNNTLQGAYTLETLHLLHALKTGALIKASVLLGAIPALEQRSTDYQRLATFGDKLGLLYQVCDDILDVTANAETLGKASGTDYHLGKRTFVDLLSLDGAKEYAKTLCGQAIEQLQYFNHSSEIEALTLFVYERIKS
jgi:farnesyl diphosphate synthase